MSGLRRLGSLVSGWAGPGAPARARDGAGVGHAGRRADAGEDAAGAALQIAWPQAVGEDIARRSRPVKLRHAVLTVMTASSTWSDQLTHLAPRILEALRQAVPQARVNRLRFVVAAGRSKALLEGVRPRDAGQAPAASSGSPAAGREAGPLGLGAASRKNEPETASEAHPHSHAAGGDPLQTVARLRALQAELDAERDRAGWALCVSCGRRFAPVSRRNVRCAPCGAARSARGLARIERLLVETPWLDETGVLLRVPQATPRAYERARQRLLARWQQEIDAATRRLRRGTPTAADRILAWNYVMLATGLPERALGRAVVIEVLGSQWAAALFDTPAGGVQEARLAPREKR